MSETIATPSEVLAAANRHTTGQPLCPACNGGYLHPFKVEINLSAPDGWEGADHLVGWVAVCRGNADYKRTQADRFPDRDLSGLVDVPPCGFSMSMTPYKRD